MDEDTTVKARYFLTGYGWIYGDYNIETGYFLDEEGGEAFLNLEDMDILD